LAAILGGQDPKSLPQSIEQGDLFVHFRSDLFAIKGEGNSSNLFHRFTLDSDFPEREI